MAATPAVDLASSSPGATSTTPATSTSFTSAPINPVVTSSHRRHKTDGNWLNDSQNQNADNTGDSPSSSGTQDEDIRTKPRPSSAGSHSSTSSNKKQETQILPSLSSGSAALLQLRSNDSPGNRTKATGDPLTGQKLQSGTSPNQLNSFRRPTSRVREEGNPLIPDEDMNDEDADPSAPPSPTDQRDIRIMFHGREIFAEDLIGLRVAKTFAGHGRFLGQVVKFDKRVSLYTVVYADGDAEDLTVDGTLQILIQDEIERADPAQPSPAISLLFKKGEEGSSPASPDTGDFMMPPPSQRPVQRRTKIEVSEREAQFVISLFENHALPSLVRQGWRVQTSNAGRGETRFVSPSGEIFPSALDVVGHIATDKELLTTCFPANVHSAILSLLPPEPAASSAAFPEVGSNNHGGGSTSRKRTTSDSPNQEQFDGKRTRQAREQVYGGITVPMRGRLGRSGNTLYRPDDLDRRAEAASRMAAYRGQGMGGRIRMSGDRFVSGETTSEARIQAPPELRGYRRASSRDPTLENPFSSRWSGAEQIPGRMEAAEYARRFANSPGWRERGDAFISDRQLGAHPRNRIRAEGRYIHRLSDSAEATVVASGTPTSYYRDSTGSSPGGKASPMTNGIAYPQYSTMRPRPGDYTRVSAAPRVSREMASFMSPTDTLGASAAFSMVDVDRISKSRPGSAHTEQPHGRSPRQSEAQQAFLQHQALQHHRRTNSGHSYRGNESLPNEAPKEQHTPGISAPPQPHE